MKAKRVLREAGQGGRVDWSVPRNLIAYDKVGGDGFYDIYTMRPDGSEDTCITCSVSQLPGLNIGSPQWHPSGDWMVFVAQRENLLFNNSGRPGVGVANDVWISDTTLTKFWKIANTSGYPNNGGVLHPTFSHAGDKLFWVERINSIQWILKLADFRVVDGTPTLVNARQLIAQGARGGLVESHDFTPDDTKVIFSGNLEGQPEPRGIDIYMLDINNGSWVNLTNTPDQWDEHAHVIPGMNKILWMSSTQTYGDGGTVSTTKTEYWTMNLDGSQKHKLSWFNDERSAYWNAHGGGVVADFDFNADATQMVMYLINDGSRYGNTGMNLMLDLEVGSSSFSAASYFRPPLAPASFVSTFGLGLASRTASSDKYPTNLAGSTATITDARGDSRLAQLVFASPGQLNFLVPEGTAPGPADLTITNEAGQTTRETFTVEAAAPAVFAANQNGTGPAAGMWQSTGDAAATLTFENQGSSYRNRVITLGSGETYLVLFGTGIRGGNNVTVTIGGITAPIAYKGPGGGFPGLDQVNVLIPSSLAGKDADYTVNMSADGAAANPVTIHIR